LEKAGKTLRCQCTATQRQRYPVTDKRIDKCGGISDLEHGSLHRFGLVKDERQGANRFRGNLPVGSPFAQCRMGCKNIGQISGNVSPEHRTCIDGSRAAVRGRRGDRLHSAITSFTKIEIDGWWGVLFDKVSLDANPALLRS